MDEVSDTLKRQLAYTERVQALLKIAFWLDYPQYKVDPVVVVGIYNWMVRELGEEACKIIYADNAKRITPLLFALIEQDPEKNFERVMTTLRLLGFAESIGFENNGYPRGKS